MMEEWLAFTETFSLSLLEGLTWPPGSQAAKEAFTEQWSLLRPAVLYFMKYKDGQHAPERILQAQKWLLDYGKSVEKVSSNVDPARCHRLMRMRMGSTRPSDTFVLYIDLLINVLCLIRRDPCLFT